MFRKVRSLLLVGAHNRLRNGLEFNKILPAALRLTQPSTHRFRCAQVKEVEPPGVLENVDFNSITNGDAEVLKKLKLIILEMDVLRQEGFNLPSSISTDKWKELLTLPSRSQRMKQLRFWFITEMKKVKDRVKKVQKREERLAKLDEEAASATDNHITYGFKGSTIFVRIYDTTIDRWKNSRLIDAMMFGQPIVIDCSYDQHMNLKEVSNCALQMSYVFAENRAHTSPYNMYFCNADRSTRLMSKFQKMIPTLYNDDFPVNVSEKSYLDLFPKEKLVYLTPHCREELINYNHDDIYIIGAMVDKVNCDPLSLAKAKAEGLRMAQLPLDRYLSWGIGTKSLTLNQVIAILLDMKVSNHWDKAFRHVPRRKVHESTEKIKRQKKLISMRELYG